MSLLPVDSDQTVAATQPTAEQFQRAAAYSYRPRVVVHHPRIVELLRSLCPACCRRMEPVRVHGHDQCPYCRTVVRGCCEGACP